MRALVSIFAALLILISLYQLSFTWFVNKHEKSIKEKAMQQTRRAFPAAAISTSGDAKSAEAYKDSSERYYEDRL
ncbi:MAG: hypothetical protein ABI415_05850, partial [Flavitalea sp.]